MPTAGKIYGTIRTRHTRGAGRDRKGRIHGSRSREGGDRALPREERRDRRVSHVRRGGRACCREGGGRGSRRHECSLPASGRSGGHQGPDQREGPALHVRLEDPEGLRQPLRRDGDQELEVGGRGGRRPREHGRVRDGLLHRELRPRPHREPLRHVARPRRQLRRQRRGRRRRPRDRGSRHGHGRLHPPARELLQLRGPQAELRTRLALRRDRVREFARPGWSHDEERHGRRAPSPGTRWPRRDGRHHARHPRARLRKGA